MIKRANILLSTHSCGGYLFPKLVLRIDIAIMVASTPEHVSSCLFQIKLGSASSTMKEQIEILEALIQTIKRVEKSSETFSKKEQEALRNELLAASNAALTMVDKEVDVLRREMLERSPPDSERSA